MFNAEINRKSMEQLVNLTTDAMRQGFPAVTISMSSTGGDPDAAIYGYNALSALPIALTTHNIGAVQSAAVLPFLAGKTRLSSPSSFFFFHQTAVNFDGGRLTEAYLASKLEIVKREDERTAQIIANETGQSVERVNEWQGSDLVMGNTLALSAGVISGEAPLSVPGDAWVLQMVT